MFVRLVVELTINLYGVWMFDVGGGKWFIFNAATEEVNNRYPSRSGQIAHIWCQGPQASPTSLYSIWSEYWEELTDFVASALSVLRVDFTSHDGRARARISPGAVLTSKWGGEAEQWYFLVEWSELSSSEDHTEMMRFEHKTYCRTHEMVGLELHLTPVHRGVGYSTTRLRLIPHEGPSCLTSVSLWPFTLQRDIPSMLHSSPSWKILCVCCFVVQIFNFWFRSL